MHGLFLQGAGWDVPNCAMQESNQGQLFTEVPIIWLKPLNVEDYAAAVKALPMPDYDCPLYKTSERKGTLSTTGHSTNFVMYLQIKYHEEEPAHWTRRGVALLCMLDD